MSLLDQNEETRVGETLAGVAVSNDPDQAWSQEATQVRMGEPFAADRQVIGQHDLSALTVKKPGESHHVKWRYVWPITGLVAIAASTVVVMAVDPIAVRDFISPPQPEMTTTTVTSPPLTQTETATVTAPPVTETTTAPPPVPGPQVFLQHMRDQGWTDNPDNQLTNGRAACSDLAGPPRRTVEQVAAADDAHNRREHPGNSLGFPLVEAFIITASVDLCPQYR